MPDLKSYYTLSIQAFWNLLVQSGSANTFYIQTSQKIKDSSHFTFHKKKLISQPWCVFIFWKLSPMAKAEKKSIRIRPFLYLFVEISHFMSPPFFRFSVIMFSLTNSSFFPLEQYLSFYPFFAIIDEDWLTLLFLEHTTNLPLPLSLAMFAGCVIPVFDFSISYTWFVTCLFLR